MSKIPEIKGPNDTSDFHDSSLIHLSFEPGRDTINVILSTPDEWDNQHLFMIVMTGVLRVEFETLGTGDIINDEIIHPEIYDVYSDRESDEYIRWTRRLKSLRAHDPEQVYNIVLASSFLRGWGEREYLEGIQIICRRVEVKSVPKHYTDSTYFRPKIPDK